MTIGIDKVASARHPIYHLERKTNLSKFYFPTQVLQININQDILTTLKHSGGAEDKAVSWPDGLLTQSTQTGK